MRIAICDDEKKSVQSLRQAVERWSKARGLSTIEITCFTSSEDLLEDWRRRPRYDVFFLDIDIPKEMNGMELARILREGDEEAVIIFVTHFANYAGEGYRVNALRFLGKPFDEQMVFESMDVAYRQWKARQEQARIPIRQGEQIVVLYARSIRYVEVRAHNLEIHRLEPDAPVVVRMRLEDLLSQLPKELFVRCHRSFAVNLHFVRRIGRSEIELSGGAKVPVGERFVAQTSDALIRFFQGGER